MKHFLKFILLISFLISCNQSSERKNSDTENNTIARLYWLAGKWQSVSENIITTESWVIKNNKLMSGNSYVISGNDTLFSENIALQQNGNELYYIPTINDQNNGEPVPFKFIEYRDGEYIFENKEHDYPQRIIYKNPQPDFLCARIEGLKEGKLIKEDFNFVKVK